MPEISNDFENYWEPPEWLNESYMEKVLQKHEQDNSLKISSMFIKPAVAKGEHYASCMYRMKISYCGNQTEEKSVSIICKTNNLDETADKMFLGYQIYKQEMKMYKKFLPELHKLLKSSNIDCDLSPKSLAINYNQNSIIFEDLNEKQFIMAPRVNGLDRTHARLVLKKLAKMHAASVIYNEQNEQELSKYFVRGMFNRKSDGINIFFSSNLGQLANEISTWDEWGYYAKKLYALKDRMIENARCVFDPKSENFNVLTHGDLWVNNVMFKYNEDGIPIDTLMVDFQMPVWGSPAIDVLYFMATSLSDDLRNHHQDEFIQYYHTCLSNALNKLKFTGKIPTLHEIQLEFLRNYFYSFTSTVLVLPVMMSEHSAGIDILTLMGLDDYSTIYRKKIYEDKKFHKILKHALPMFDKKGILDM